ncbi:hypothetical protein KSP39_PZI007162 [Platanthera zijinensis]|uniref:Glutaredoxin domain-containing protein n=1 Tax=Platanthera zijinensis TaxID=2320716 RepID=A0AAP0BNR2_9ASPA
MGCFSSKLNGSRDLRYYFSGSPKSISDFDDGDLPNHIVSLTSSTYGVLNLDPPENLEQPSSSIIIPRSRNLSFNDRSPEIINWTVEEDFEDAGKIACSPKKKSSIRPLALFTPSPKFRGKFFGKENSCPRYTTAFTDPNRVLKPLIFSERMQLKTPKSSSKSNKSSSRRSLSPMFDPELVSFFERELHEESEQTRQILLTATTNLKEEEVRDFLRSFEKKCPRGGEKVAVLYTTTLRGIRKTFDECNMVRSVIGSYDVCVIERDISMDLGFREEMRMLIGSKDARPPILFAKGRMVGGAEEVMRLEEEGKLGLLLEGMPKAVRCCEDCGGMSFVMCKVCNGSCKVLVQGEKKMTKCGECNENGLVHCASCSKIANGLPSILT